MDKTPPEDNSPSRAKGSSMDPVQESEGPDHPEHSRDGGPPPEGEQPPPWSLKCPACGGPLTVLDDEKVQSSSSNQDIYFEEENVEGSWMDPKMKQKAEEKALPAGEGSSSQPAGDCRGPPQVPGQPENDGPSSEAEYAASCQRCGGTLTIFLKISLDNKGDSENRPSISSQGRMEQTKSIQLKKKLKAGLELRKSKSPVKVGYIITGKTFGAAETIMERVKSNSLSIKKINTTKVRGYDIIIIFCPVSSRVGSDVDAAMRSVSVSENPQVFLVVMHHTRDVDYPTAGRKWSEEYRIKEEFNVLFHETHPGLLRCPQNKKEISALKEKLH